MHALNCIENINIVNPVQYTCATIMCILLLYRHNTTHSVTTMRTIFYQNGALKYWHLTSIYQLTFCSHSWRIWKGLSATHLCCKMTITYCLMTIVVYFMPTPCWYITIGNTREYMHVAKWQLHFALFYLFQNNYVFLASLCFFFYQLVSY